MRISKPSRRAVLFTAFCLLTTLASSSVLSTLMKGASAKRSSIGVMISDGLQIASGPLYINGILLADGVMISDSIDLANGALISDGDNLRHRVGH